MMSHDKSDMADKSSWQVQIFGSVLIVTRHLDVTLLRRKYHVTEVGCEVGRPDRQRSYVIGFQGDPWWCLPTSRGGHNSPTAARYATISGPLSPPSSLLVPPGPRQQTQSPMIMLKPWGPAPLVGGQGWARDGWNLGPKWEVKLTNFFSDKVTLSPPHPPQLDSSYKGEK